METIKNWMSNNRGLAIEMMTSTMSDITRHGVTIKEFSLAVIEMDELWNELEWMNDQFTSDEFKVWNAEGTEKVMITVKGQYRFQEVIDKVLANFLSSSAISSANAIAHADERVRSMNAITAGKAKYNR